MTTYSNKCPTCGGALLKLDGNDLAEQQHEMNAQLAGHGHVVSAWRCQKAPCLELFWEVEPNPDYDRDRDALWSVTFPGYRPPMRQNRTGWSN